MGSQLLALAASLGCVNSRLNNSVLDLFEQMALKRQPVHAESAEILACKSGTDSKFLPSADAFKSDTQGEKKTTKSLTTPLVTETRGQGSAQTSGCLPASVREKFIFQQQRAVLSPTLPAQTGVNSAQKVVSPLSPGVTGGSAFPKFSEPVVSQMRRSRKFLLLFVKQARQNNEVGTYSRKSSAQTGASAIHSSEKAADNVRVPISTKTDSKALAGQTKSPLSSGTSSSPTSPLVTTPSSKLQPHSNKAPGALNKESGKNSSHSKSSVVGKVVSPTISKPPSSSKHGNVVVKTKSKHSGSKATLQPSKPSGHTKSSVPPSVPKRSPPTALSSPATATTTLKDEKPSENDDSEHMAIVYSTLWVRHRNKVSLTLDEKRDTAAGEFARPPRPSTSWCEQASASTLFQPSAVPATFRLPESMGLDDSDLPRTHEGKHKGRRLQFARRERWNEVPMH
ncbi:hypothetical protein AXG93_2839s1450 [Marchantia polymorpha subsp. ruderalis]|uniref:Uncharacterized protein n=1 Tax=Marchantia polymorpha subsp. ruderalis TaxID=1480154 RepID=A0A176VDV6_MARPO|nr:hypothetical protein AXG93_2839s1450 [Marchantia polymorpha subsp. ruderalis]